MSITVIDNCNVFDGRNEEYRAQQIVVEDGKIVDLRRRKAAPAGSRTLDGHGCVAMPGLIDAHVHAIAAEPNLALLDRMPMSYISQFARSSLERMLQRGFTTVRDAAGADYGIKQAIDKGYIKGPRLFFSGKALTQTGGHGDSRSYECGVCGCGASRVVMATVVDGVSEVRKAAREALRRGSRQIKIMASGGVASQSDPIGNLQFSEEEIRAAVWEATSWGRYVLAHAYTAEAVTRSLEFGVRSIEHANLIDQETADLIASKQAFVVPTLVTYEALQTEGKKHGVSDASMDKLQVVRNAGLRSLEYLQRAKAKIGFGTDLLGPMQDMQLDEFRIRADVFTPFELLRSATSINASLLQEDGRLGVIAPGASADILLVEGDPLRDVQVIAEMETRSKVIMKGGKIFKNVL